MKLRLFKSRERLEALLQEAAAKETSYSDFLERVLSEEVAAKTSKNVTMRTSMARFPFVKPLETFDFTYQPSIDRKQVQTLATCHFIEHGDNVLVLGPPGVGKTHCDNRLSMARQRQRCQAAPCRIGMTRRLIGASRNVAFALDMSPIRKGAGLTTGDWPD